MSKACFVREDLIFDLKRWCDTNGISIIGSPFKCDFQLVGDELLQQGGITVSMTIDSDFFALGSRIILDCLDIRTGCCNIIRSYKYFESKAGAILCNSDGTSFDMAVCASFVGCDFIAHQYLQSEACVIKTLMPAGATLNWNQIKIPVRIKNFKTFKISAHQENGKKGT
jgi:hypothetical protein